MSASAAAEGTAAPSRRWIILAGAVLLQLALGGVYAWSTFSKAMTSADAFGWSTTEVAIPFETAIGMIFVGSFLGGRLQDARGPRTVAMVGGLIYSAGVIIASFANQNSFWLLIFGYGVIAGFGLGMAYIVPIAMLQNGSPIMPD